MGEKVKLLISKAVSAISKKHDPTGQQAVMNEAKTAEFWLEHVSLPLTKRYPSLARLRDSLLRHGGRDVLFHPWQVFDGGKLLKRGHLFATEVVHLKGPPGRCHHQSAAMFALGVAPTIVTGFALDSDDLFYQHSWCLSKEGTILEVGPDPLQFYWGTELSPEEAARLQWLCAYGVVSGVLL